MAARATTPEKSLRKLGSFPREGGERLASGLGKNKQGHQGHQGQQGGQGEREGDEGRQGGFQWRETQSRRPRHPPPMSLLWPDQPPQGQLLASIESMLNLQQNGTPVERVQAQGRGGGGKRS